MSTQPGPATRRRQLGRQLRELRLDAGITTIKAASDRSGLSTATISRIERANRTIPDLKAARWPGPARRPHRTARRRQGRPLRPLTAPSRPRRSALDLPAAIPHIAECHWEKCTGLTITLVESYDVD